MGWFTKMFGGGNEELNNNLVVLNVKYVAKGPGREVRSHGTIVRSPYGTPSGEEITDAIKADLKERGMPVDEVDISDIQIEPQ